MAFPRLRILVVEDAPVWRDGLAAMYCRLLRRTREAGKDGVAECRACLRRQQCLDCPATDLEPKDNLHPDITAVSSGTDAIRLLGQFQDGFEVLSLDINLGSQHSGFIAQGAHGLDVLNHAYRTQPRLCVIVVTAASHDCELPEQLSADEDRRVRTLQSELQERLPLAHRYFPKRILPEASTEVVARAVKTDIEAWETTLSLPKLAEMVDIRTSAYKTRNREQGYCLAFVLPDSCFQDEFGDPVPVPGVVPLHPHYRGYWGQIRFFGELETEEDFDFVKILEMLHSLPERYLGIAKLSRADPPTVKTIDAFSRQPTPAQFELLLELASRDFNPSAFEDAARESKNAPRKTAISRLRSYLDKQATGSSQLIALHAEGKYYYLTQRMLILACNRSVFQGQKGQRR